MEKNNVKSCVLCGRKFEYHRSLPFTDVCEKCLDDVWFSALNKCTHIRRFLGQGFS